MNTQNDHVRTCLSNLQNVGDDRALEKYCQWKCLRSALIDRFSINKTWPAFESLRPAQLVLKSQLLFEDLW